MRHIDHCGAKTALQMLDLTPHMRAQFCVKVGDGFIEQEQLGFAHDRPPDGHALFLAARQFGWSTVQQMVNLQQFGGGCHAFLDLVRSKATQTQRIGDIIEHRFMRIKRIVFKHHRHIAVFGRQIVDPLAIKQDVARADMFQPGDHPHGG